VTRAERRRGAAGLALVAAALGLAACATGEGEGYVVGRFYLLGCDGVIDYGSADAPAFFDLRANFFVGEPILDDSAVAPRNRLDLRLQRDGNTVEDADSLYFQLDELPAVAGQFARYEGTPIGTGQVARASLLLYVTCPTYFGRLEATSHPGQAACPTLDASTVEALCDDLDLDRPTAPAVPLPPFLEGGSCLIFCTLGSARRGAEVAADFAVDFGDTVRGIFSLTLVEQRLAESQVEICADGVDNDGDGEIDEDGCTRSTGFGYLQGAFEFEVRRGQVTQEFP
jgi:hypothetical protein